MSSSGMDPILERVRASILPGLKPVKPMAKPRVWIAALLLVFLAIALAGAARMGMYGLRVLHPAGGALIFTLLAAAAVLSAIVLARQMVPAGGRLLPPAILATASVAAFLAAFAFLFRGYDLYHFAGGVSCLEAGLIHAAVSALLIALILRRGFVLDRVAAGTAAGTLAGLVGLAVLELHCPILKAVHVLVWHTSVVVLSAAGGAAVGWLTPRAAPPPAARA
jgi:hypothetical protein